MQKSGVTRLKPDPARKRKSRPARPGTKPIQFDGSFDWVNELQPISPDEKYAGRKPTPKPKPAKKLKITRNLKPDTVLDLHGETQDSALARVQHAIQTAVQGNHKTLLIITGKGINSGEQGGVLRKAVWNWLTHCQTDHAFRFRWSPPFLGGKGAILVVF